MTERLVSAIGVFVFLGIAAATCPRERRRHISRRTVLGALAILVAVATLVLRTPASRAFTWLNDAVDALLGFSARGAAFVFGSLVTERATFGSVFAFQVLPSILFFASLTSVLYHLGTLPWLVSHLSRFMARRLGTSGAETFSTVADVFVGMTEAPLAIRPYVARLTDSELFACLVAGFATTAGGVLAAYVAMLRGHVDGIAGHLIASSVMGAPASLAIAKLMMPETGLPETVGAKPLAPEKTTTNTIDALAAGAIDGTKLAVNVAAMLIVFLAATAMLDAGLGWVSGLFGAELSLHRLLGWLFYPLALCLGVPGEDVQKVAGLLGQKTALNEFVAYATLSQKLSEDPTWLTERGRTLAAYALCGFANFGSIGIQIGGYASIAPGRRTDLSRLALRAMFGGLLATNLVACVAGVLL